jgi:hypothetical protein
MQQVAEVTAVDRRAMNGFAIVNAARHSNGGTGMIRRGLCSPSKMRSTISR